MSKYNYILGVENGVGRDMNITFLIGNGFDIELGIASSYSNFYKWYYEQPSPQKHIESFKKNIKEDINRESPEEEKTWADFELGLGKYTARFTKETVDDFLDCLEDGQENIRKYLLEQEAKFDPDTYTDDSYMSFYESIRDFYAEVPDLERPNIQTKVNSHGSEDTVIKFITFNYTSTLERIFSKIPSNPYWEWGYGSCNYSYRMDRDVLHVHGTTSEFPILGVNDETQIVNKELLETPQFKEIMCKADCVRALGMLWHEEAEKQISSSRYICILGMSLGDSDAKWWRKLNQWLRADSGRHLIIYWYEKESPNGISIRKELQGKEKVRNRLISFSNLSTAEIQDIKPRIHVIINTKKFLKLQKPIRKSGSEKETEAVLATM